MGIYYDHGIEYHVNTIDSNGCIKNFVIVSTKDSDVRLLNSDYFKNNINTWFTKYSEYKCKIHNDIIKLTPKEEEYLQYVLEKNSNSIIDHGFYEIITISTTY